MDLPPEAHVKAGVGQALARHELTWPVHGMRHPPHGDTSGWYIWTGDLTDAPDFFVPLHPSHLAELVPGLMDELSAPPGSRFLLAPGQRDVWQDAALLEDE